MMAQIKEDFLFLFFEGKKVEPQSNNNQRKKNNSLFIEFALKIKKMRVQKLTKKKYLKM